MEVEKNFLLDDSSETSSSSSLELVIDKSKKNELKLDAIQETNIYDVDMDEIKDKPWLKPGADITDFFNYGFTERTWKRYCEMQRENRTFVEKQGPEPKYQRRDDKYTDGYNKHNRHSYNRYDDGYNNHSNSYNVTEENSRRNYADDSNNNLSYDRNEHKNDKFYDKKRYNDSRKIQYDERGEKQTHYDDRGYHQGKRYKNDKYSFTKYNEDSKRRY